MKPIYIIIITLLVVIFLIFEYQVLYKPLGEHPRLEKVIQSTGIFVALLAAVIALSAADPRKGKVKVNINPSIDEEREHPQSEMLDDLKKAYNGFPDPVRSHRVQFKMTNNSCFTLKKPTITFRVPIPKKHPHRRSDNKPWSVLTFNSNLYNYRAEFRMLEFADTSILSNSNLPYWNDKDQIMLWIRMVMDDGKLEPFIVEVSVNCENANGATEKIRIKPKELLESLKR